MAKPGDDFDGANVSPSGLPQPDKLSAMIGSDRIGGHEESVRSMAPLAAPSC